ncbi:hypothetical protein MITS9509_03068 [Synechococcus sp. MIT S9509]|nr:hypothetical protein MITS9509_03068 [Synechococcus sp. MIT S9509]
MVESPQPQPFIDPYLTLGISAFERAMWPETFTPAKDGVCPEQPVQFKAPIEPLATSSINASWRCTQLASR